MKEFCELLTSLIIAMLSTSNATILMHLREVAFENLPDDLLPKLSEAIGLYHNLFDLSPPHLNHMKQSLEIAKALGIDTQRRERSDECRLCFEAAVVMVLANRPEGKAVQYDSLNILLREYPEFLDTEEIEQTKLLFFRNLMAVALLILPANHNRAHLLNLITRITEGRCVKYVTGSGAMRSTRRRVLIYEREGKIVPSIRPPRKDSKPPRKPPRRKRKRELPPGCTSFIVSNTYNEHSLRIQDADGEADQQDNNGNTGQTVDIDDLPMFIRIPTQACPISSIKVPAYSLIPNKDKLLEVEFNHFLRTVWLAGISTPCFGWVGTLLVSDSKVFSEKVENDNRAKNAFAKMLEMYYHIFEGGRLLKVKDLYSEPYLKECHSNLRKLFVESTFSFSDTHTEHLLVLGLFFCIRRCKKRGFIQYYGDVNMRKGSDICVDFLQSVEVYFTMLFRLSSTTPDAKSAPVMLIALENSHSRVMEIYFRLKCALESGLLYLHQSTWALIRESVYTEFYLMRYYMLGLSSRKSNSDNEDGTKSCAEEPMTTEEDLTDKVAEEDTTEENVTEEVA